MKARIGDFLKKAGTVLFLAMLVIWFFRSFSPQLQFVSDSTQSMLAQFGMAIAPIFSLCGFPSWQAAVSLATDVYKRQMLRLSLFSNSANS